MTKFSSLTETFFKEIPFEDFMNSISDDTPQNSFDVNQEYYKARYDNFFQLTNISETELKQIINSFKTKFIEDNGSFDEEVFRNSNSYDIKLFLAEIKDYLNTLSKGKVHTIEKCNNKFIHHFELSLDVTSGKTLIISTKTIDQIRLYFKTIKQIIEETIIEKFDKPKSVFRDNELKGFKIEDYDKISKFRNELIEFGFIDTEITLGDFREIFDDKKPTKKIIWKKPLNQLHSLIKLMFEEKIMSKYDEKKWLITANVFSILSKEKGVEEFDSNKIRTANKCSSKAEDDIRNILKLSEFL